MTLIINIHSKVICLKNNNDLLLSITRQKEIDDKVTSKYDKCYDYNANKPSEK